MDDEKLLVTQEKSGFRVFAPSPSPKAGFERELFVRIQVCVTLLLEFSLSLKRGRLIYGMRFDEIYSAQYCSMAVEKIREKFIYFDVKFITHLLFQNVKA